MNTTNTRSLPPARVCDPDSVVSASGLPHQNCSTSYTDNMNNGISSRLPRMRTLKEAYAELLTVDPDTGVSMYSLRRFVLSGSIPYIKAGARYLVDLNNVFDFFASPPEASKNQTDTDSTTRDGIRPVNDGRY